MCHVVACKNGEIFILGGFQQNTVQTQQALEFRIVNLNGMTLIRFQIGHQANIARLGSVPQQLVTLLARHRTRQSFLQRAIGKTQFIRIPIDDVSQGVKTIQNVLGHEKAGLQRRDITTGTNAALMAIDHRIAVSHLEPATPFFVVNLACDRLPGLSDTV